MKSFGHTFHIPVLGVGYSVDAPIKVARYGISSVISLVDDTIIEKLRKFYSEKNNKPYNSIKTTDEDSRAKRITAYLNMIKEIVDEQFEKLKKSEFVKGSEITKYFEMLPDYSELKILYSKMINSTEIESTERIKIKLRESINCGDINVNIMTKLDKENYNAGNEQLPIEFNDAHAALRGYALSNLNSSIIFSAGINPKLYSYMESFHDFFPSGDGSFKKKIVIKVSDFRSALIQGKFLAKKGLWVSEFRIESGLNCGGHAFATDGLLLGPILEEFKNRKEELLSSLKELYLPALIKKGIHANTDSINFDVTVQGGVGNSSEHEFLLRYYGVKSVGWGSPFLLVPEVMNVDEYTLEKLCTAEEKDYYLSNISPLGVPFNSLRGNSKDLEKEKRIEDGKPGSPCPKKFLISNKEFSEKPICTASITYINKKITELKNSSLNGTLKKALDKVVEKACLCEGLTVTPMIVNKIEMKKQSMAVSVCPGPNLAYYSKVVSLKEMVDHIYNKINLITNPNRPNLFVKELSLYINYLQNKIEEKIENASAHSEEFIETFRCNLMSGMEYYKRIILELNEETESVKQRIIKNLEELEQKLSLSFVLER
jgi:hypothetical protein